MDIWNDKLVFSLEICSLQFWSPIMVCQALFMCCLVLPCVLSGIQSSGAKPENYHREVDKLIEKSIRDFEHEQKEKMKAGFTSDARRSYKKTK